MCCFFTIDQANLNQNQPWTVKRVWTFHVNYIHVHTCNTVRCSIDFYDCIFPSLLSLVLIERLHVHVCQTFKTMYGNICKHLKASQ